MSKHVISGEPSVVRNQVFAMQLCVPATWSDDAVLDFARSQAGASWRVQDQGDHTRVACDDNAAMKHIVVEEGGVPTEVVDGGRRLGKTAAVYKEVTGEDLYPVEVDYEGAKALCESFGNRIKATLRHMTSVPAGSKLKARLMKQYDAVARVWDWLDMESMRPGWTPMDGFAIVAAALLAPNDVFGVQPNERYQLLKVRPAANTFMGLSVLDLYTARVHDLTLKTYSLCYRAEDPAGARELMRLRYVDESSPVTEGQLLAFMEVKPETDKEVDDMFDLLKEGSNV